MGMASQSGGGKGHLEGEACPVARAVRLLGDAWTLLVVRDLAERPCRFSQLESSLGVSPRVLTARLRALEQKGLLTRHSYAEIPPRVEYALTEKGRAALPLIEALRAYGTQWLPQLGAPLNPSGTVG